MNHNHVGKHVSRVFAELEIEFVRQLFIKRQLQVENSYVEASTRSLGLVDLVSGFSPRGGRLELCHREMHLQQLPVNVATGIVGAICALCGVGRVFAYRDQVTVRVIGQPLFAAQRHHFEQGAAGSAAPSSRRRAASSSFTEALAPAASSMTGRPGPR